MKKNKIQAVVLNKYREFVMNIKHLTQKEESVVISAGKLMSDAKVHGNTVQIMVDLKLLEKSVLKGSKNAYRWLMGEGEIKDATVISIVECVRELQRVSKAKSPARIAKTATLPTVAKVEKLPSKPVVGELTPDMEETMKRIATEILLKRTPVPKKEYKTLKVNGTPFTARQLHYIRAMKYDKPTNIAVDGVILLKEVDMITFAVKDNTITATFHVSALKEGSETLSLAIAELIFVNKILGFSDRFGDTTEGNLVLTSYPYSLTTVEIV